MNKSPSQNEEEWPEETGWKPVPREREVHSVRGSKPFRTIIERFRKPRRASGTLSIFAVAGVSCIMMRSSTEMLIKLALLGFACFAYLFYLCIQYYRKARYHGHVSVLLRESGGCVCPVCLYPLRDHPDGTPCPECGRVWNKELDSKLLSSRSM